MRIGLISGAYPPDPDGIGDYTWWMAQTLAAQPGVERPVRVFTSSGNERTAALGVQIQPVLDAQRPASFRALLTDPAIRELDWVVLQYNPFSFGRRGYCPWVPETLGRLKVLRRAPRIAVMFHETMVPTWPWKFGLMYCWQRPIFGAICAVADLAFVSTERWTPQVQRVAAHLPVYHLSVGSNVPLANVPRGEARARLGLAEDTIVLGVFGTAHISRQLDWIATTVREVARRNPSHRTALLYVGAQGGALRNSCRDIELIDSGYLSGEEVGVSLRAMDAVISPFVDGLSTRRGSMMAALQHGIPIASTRSRWTDPLFAACPEGLFLSSASGAGDFANEVAAWLDRNLFCNSIPNEQLEQFYKRNFSWERTAKTTIESLLRTGTFKGGWPP